MNSYTIIIMLLLLAMGCKKQDSPLQQSELFSLEEMAFLPTVLDECSGMERSPENIFWSINDNKGKAELYGFDHEGILIHTIKVQNAENEDWEDLAMDSERNLYIGDFGNNDNDRTDLTIYKIHLGSTPASHANAQPIRFRFPDQAAFPPANDELHFDAEALLAKEGSLYLFTRDRSIPFFGKTTLYRLPTEPGNYEAEHLGEYITYAEELQGQITSADISPDGSTLALLAKERIYLFKNIHGDDFFGGQLERNDLPIQRQMESVVFSDNCTLYLSNEKNQGEPGALYKLTVCE